MKRTSLLAVVLALATACVAGCGGASDEVGGGDGEASAASGGQSVELSLVGYAVPKVGFDKLIPAFQKTEAGAGVTFAQSYGASGDQSRKVAAGLETDIVNFSVEPDVTRLVEAGLVDEDWNGDENKGLAFGSVVVIVTREGNPKNIEDWDDLLQPGLEVVTPNPFSSGSAKWNLLAPYAVKSNGGEDEQAGLDYISKLVDDHVEIQPKSGREATETFLQGTGDVLLSYENEAIFAKSQGEEVDYVIPPGTFKIENPVAVLNSSQARRAGHRVPRLPLLRRGPGAVGGGRLPPREPGRAREARGHVPGPGEALDDRRPRWLGRGRQEVLRRGRRVDREDLRRSHGLIARDGGDDGSTEEAPHAPACGAA